MNMPDFREHIKQVLDLAETGKIVVITRSGVTFHILCPDTVDGSMISELPPNTALNDVDLIDQIMSDNSLQKG